MSEFRTTSHAKINLNLEILYKRDDGYHELNTLFAPISLCDIMTLETNNKDLKIELIPYINIPNEKNLAYKAADLFLNSLGRKEKKFTIKLNKKIPIGGGLGGGSSNAAFTLLLLNKFFGEPASYKELNAIASILGSDVPFFLKKSFAVGKGRGELLDYFDINLPYKVLVVNPGIHISTPWAYNSLKLDKTKSNRDLKPFLYEHINDLKQWANYFVNDFEDSVFKIKPEIGFIKKKMYELGAGFALMSGSGSTVFGIFDDEELLEKSYYYFNDYFENSKVYICDFINSGN